jgi:uncharacterized protein (TIGR03000 family)
MPATMTTPAAVAPASGLSAEELDILRRFIRTLATKDDKKSSQQAAPVDAKPAAKSDAVQAAPVAKASVAEVKPAAKADAAQITVKLPASARLWVDQVECPLTSSVRSFKTPTLAPNQTYAYTLRVELQRDGETVSDRQRVLVSAGRQVEVDFTRLGSVTTAQR